MQLELYSAKEPVFELVLQQCSVHASLQGSATFTICSFP